MISTGKKQAYTYLCPTYNDVFDLVFASVTTEMYHEIWVFTKGHEVIGTGM